MHVVVVGCGRVGSELAVAVEAAGHTVSIIDKDRNAFRHLPESFKGKAILGFGFDRDHLEQAGIEQADALAAVTNGDNSNVLAARIARETYEIPHVVARIYDPRRAVIYQRLGIQTVATVAWTTDQVLRRLFPDESVSEWTDAIRHDQPGRAGTAGRLGRAQAGRAGRARQVPPGGAVAVPARPGCSAPRSSARRATCCTSPSTSTPSTSWRPSSPARRRPRRPTSEGRAMKVAIAGAGNVGTYIAADLKEAGHEVMVIEQDPDLVARLRLGLDVRWVVADACEVSSLHEAGLAEVDVVVAATGDDEDNLVISLLAKQEFAVPRVVAQGQPSRQPVAVQRDMGRRRLGVDPPPADRAGGGGGVGGVAGAPAPVPGRPPGGGHPRRQLAGGGACASPSSACLATPPSWPSSATGT